MFYIIEVAIQLLASSSVKDSKKRKGSESQQESHPNIRI